jgi:16S rRNA (guanine966-N2)-methyltransferase
MASAGRVIAGSARGVRLLAPGEGTRPLSDRVKQTLFGILEAGSLGPWPTAFLDLFAGSGAAGIEALSRGADRVVFVERDPAAARVIRENLRRAGVALARPVEARAGRRARADRAGHEWGDGTRRGDGHERGGEPRDATVVQADVVRFLDSDEIEEGAPFGAVLVDPPYGDAVMLPVLDRLGDARRRWLAPGAVVVAKHFWRDALPRATGRLEQARQRRFGETMLTFYTTGPTG